MDGADLDAARFAQVVDRGFDVFGRGAERDEDRIGVVGLVFGEQAVVAAGELAEVLVGVFEELQNRLGEVVAPRHDALHVVFLVLHRAKQDRDWSGPSSWERGGGWVRRARAAPRSGSR